MEITSKMDNPQVVFLKYFNLKFGIYSNGDVYNFDGLEPKKLKFYVRKDGYAHFIFNNKIFYHHRIIAKAFIPNPHNYPVINHIDGNKLNNCVENLEWCSISYNN